MNGMVVHEQLCRLACQKSNQENEVRHIYGIDKKEEIKLKSVSRYREGSRNFEGT